MDIAKPSITRLARRAGIKSLSDDTYDCIRELIDRKIAETVQDILIVNSEKQNKTLMASDLYESLSIKGENITFSGDLGTKVAKKKKKLKNKLETDTK